MLSLPTSSLPHMLPLAAEARSFRISAASPILRGKRFYPVILALHWQEGQFVQKTLIFRVEEAWEERAHAPGAAIKACE